MSRRFTFAWSPDPRLRSFAPVASVADLDTALDAVRAASAAAGMPLQVDIWSGDWSGNEPIPEPFVQAVRDAPAELVATGARPSNVAWMAPFDDEEHPSTV